MEASPSIPDIIKKAGGPDAIAERTRGKLSRWAVYKWPQNGIPDQHWSLLIDMARVTPKQLLAANEAVRSVA